MMRTDSLFVLRPHLLSRSSIALAALLLASCWATPSLASGIFGTLSNFDIYNTTPEPCEGAEIELEGIHPEDIGGDFPAHYDSKSITEYFDTSNNFLGTRIRYTGYNFPGAPVPGSLQPNPNPASTNGHALTYTAGGEHFGFWLGGAQPTATRFFWLNDNNGTYERIGDLPEVVPSPTWSYVPPAQPGDAPRLQAAVRVPEPEDQPVLRPDSTWMRVWKTKLEDVPAENMQELLDALISGDPNDPNYINLVPQGEIEIESEWELLEGGAAPKEKMQEDDLEENDNFIIRRYEFFEYTGAYDEEHEPLSLWEDLGNPLDPGLDVFDGQGNVLYSGEVGSFLSANMVAAVIGNGFAVPEPSSVVLCSLALIVAGVAARRRRLG